MKTLAVTAATLAAVGMMASAQQSKTFRTEINYVELHVSVTTKDGQRVHGLTKADFAVRESGSPQAIEIADEIALPLPAPRDRKTFEPDASVSDAGLIEKGRLYVVVIDRGHLEAANAPKLQRQLAEFIDDFVAPSDLVAVVNLGSSAVTPFTANKTRLRAGLGLLSAYRTPADSSDLKVPEGSGGKEDMVSESIASEIAALAEAETERDATAAAGSFDSMDALARYMRGFEGRRKALVYVSGGLDVNSPMPGEKPAINGSSNAISGAFQRMVSSLQANNITVYSIDPNGLATFDAFDGGGSAVPLSKSFGPKYVGLVAMLRAVADDTGGFPIVGFNDLTKPFARIVEDNSDYYVLGYSSNRPADGKAHTIAIEVKGRPDIVVRARRQIEAASAKSKPNPVDAAWRNTDLVSLLDRPVPTVEPGLRLRLTASPVSWRGDKAVVQLAVEIHEGGLTLAEAAGAWADDVTAAFRAIDEKGVIKAAKSETVKVRARPETRAAIDGRGWRYLNEFEVPAGIYQLRVAVSETGGGKSGSAFLDLAVPDIRKAPLSVIGLALTSDAARRMPSAGTSPTIQQTGQMVITAARTFSGPDIVYALASVVDNIGSDHTATITASLVTPDGKVAKELSEAVDAKKLTQGSPPRALAIALATVPPGDYLLVVKVDAGGKSAKRTAVIRVTR